MNQQHNGSCETALKKECDCECGGRFHGIKSMRRIDEFFGKQKECYHVEYSYHDDGSKECNYCGATLVEKGAWFYALKYRDFNVRKEE